jgi:hypothetical protein
MNVTLAPDLVGCLRALLATEIARVEQFNRAHGLAGHHVYLAQLAAISKKLAADTKPRKADAQSEEMADVLSELADLMDDVISGEYTPDSFTTQPARRVLSSYGKHRNPS